MAQEIHVDPWRICCISNFCLDEKWWQMLLFFFISGMTYSVNQCCCATNTHNAAAESSSLCFGNNHQITAHDKIDKKKLFGEESRVCSTAVKLMRFFCEKKSKHHTKCVSIPERCIHSLKRGSGSFSSHTVSLDLNWVVYICGWGGIWDDSHTSPRPRVEDSQITDRQLQSALFLLCDKHRAHLFILCCVFNLKSTGTFLDMHLLTDTFYFAKFYFDFYDLHWNDFKMFAMK